MAYGDALGKAYGSFFDAGSKEAVRASVYGNLFDMGMSYLQNQREQQAAANARYMQEQLVQQQAQLASQRAAEETQLRQRTLDRAAQLDLALKGAMAKLGPRVGVNPGDIYNNYTTFRTQIMDDYNDTVDRISSQGFANAIRRGMDSSTQFDEEKATLARKAASELPKLDQAAFDAAIARSKSYADSLNYGREATMKEFSDMTNSVANIEKNLLTNNAGNLMSGASSSYSTVANAYGNQADDSQEFLGNAVGRFTEKIAPNIGYAFGEGGTFTDTSDAATELAKYKSIYGDLKDKK